MVSLFRQMDGCNFINKTLSLTELRGFIYQKRAPGHIPTWNKYAGRATIVLPINLKIESLSVFSKAKCK